MEQKLSMMSNSEQQKLKPTIEEVAPELFSGEDLLTILDFADYLRSSKTPLRISGVANAWKAMCKGKAICYVRLAQPQYEKMRNHKYKWAIVIYLSHIREYEKSIIDEGYQDLLLSDLQMCGNCKLQCDPKSKVITILGKEISGICRGYYDNRMALPINDPDKAAINVIKKLLEIEKEYRTKAAKA
ncbi:MAG: hypothetical protein FWD16_04795 [Clostridia bacterium]|nr:hypothetical protein [Clostridia bacterium]